jgi:hypothetical protein
MAAADGHRPAYVPAQRCKLKIMTETPKESLHWLRAVLWAVIWSTVLTTFMMFVMQANNRCLLIINGASWMWTLSALIWFWLLLFLVFGNRGRLILLGFTLLVLLARGSVDRFPLAVGEARAVMHLRRLSEAVDSYRREHPVEGFPASLPPTSKGDDTDSTAKLYSIDYTTSRSSSSGPVDRFLIQANPLWRDCGFVRSFAVTDDGGIHFTVEPRPATKSDKTLQ